MKLTGTPQRILGTISARSPRAIDAVHCARGYIAEGQHSKAIMDYQAAALYALASGRSGTILEIGTYYGFSAAVVAQAAPEAQVITLNPTAWEWEAAAKNLRALQNVQVICQKSWDYLDVYAGTDLSMIFVDGDHKQVKRDLPWWNKLAVGGLFLFHDYSPNGSAKACPPVYRALNEFRDYLGRDFDVLIVDDQGIGMAGWYKRENDKEYTG